MGRNFSWTTVKPPSFIGVGININQVEDTQLDQATSSLEQLGLAQADRIRLMAELYLAFQQAGLWFTHNSANLASRFNHYAAFMQQPVEFEHMKGLSQGIFLGIQDDGAVQIQTANGVENFYQGRLRPMIPV